MKRLSKGKLKIAGVGTKTRECGGCSGWYSRRSPAWKLKCHQEIFRGESVTKTSFELRGQSFHLPGREHRRHQSRRVEMQSLRRRASRKGELQEELLRRKPRTWKGIYWLLLLHHQTYWIEPPDKIDAYSRNNLDEHEVCILWFWGAPGWGLGSLWLHQEGGVLNERECKDRKKKRRELLWRNLQWTSPQDGAWRTSRPLQPM